MRECLSSTPLREVSFYLLYSRKLALASILLYNQSRSYIRENEETLLSSSCEIGNRFYLGYASMQLGTSIKAGARVTVQRAFLI